LFPQLPFKKHTKKIYMYTQLFQYNVPADNQFTGRKDFYINAIAIWNEKDFYYDGRPMIHVEPINIGFHECISVKDWYLAYRDIEAIAIEKFTEIAQQKKIDDARALIALSENPVTERLSNAKGLGTITINELGKAEPVY
jgi:hypothetical protein